MTVYKHNNYDDSLKCKTRVVSQEFGDLTFFSDNSNDFHAI